MTTQESSAPARKRNVRFPLLFALIVVTLGLWMLLDSQGIGVPPIKKIWPIFFVFGAIAAAIDYFAFSRHAGSVGQIVMWGGFAALGFAMTLGYTEWTRPLDWLPAVPTIFGLAFLATWLAGRRQDTGGLVAGLIFVGLGFTGFVTRYEKLKVILPSAQFLWAILLILVGGYVLWRTFARK